MADALDHKKKQKKEDVEINQQDLSPIAHPLAQKKLLKRLHKTIRKASKHRHVKRGVKEVAKSIRKGEKGLLVLAGDISPIDIISHLPLMCEEASVPYIFVDSKEDLGLASSTKRPTSCVFICPDGKKSRARKLVEGQTEEDEKDDEYREMYEMCLKEVRELDERIVLF